MQFNQTQTFLNLARGFAGESQAGMRYQMIADSAIGHRLFTLADEIKAIAKNETQHAKIFYSILQEKAGAVPNIPINGGYPFEGVQLVEALKNAATGEREEHTKIYPEFARIAEDEGFSDIARIFTQIAIIEKHHEVVFSYLYRELENDALFRSEKPLLWRCSECGYQTTAQETWQRCPVCQKEQGYIELHLPYTGEN